MPSKKKKYNARFPPVSLNVAGPVLKLAVVSTLCDGKLSSFALLNEIRPVLLPTERTGEAANASHLSRTCQLPQCDHTDVVGFLLHI